MKHISDLSHYIPLNIFFLKIASFLGSPIIPHPTGFFSIDAFYFQVICYSTQIDYSRTPESTIHIHSSSEYAISLYEQSPGLEGYQG